MKRSLKLASRYFFGIVRTVVRQVPDWLIAAILAVAVATASGMLLGFLLGPFADWVGGSTVRSIKAPEGQAAAINAVRQTILAAAGGTAALIGLAFTARTYYLSRSGQVADRFTKAASMLASDKPDERISGIFAMERIMVQSSADQDTVLQVLTAFVRHRASVRGLRPDSSSVHGSPGAESDAGSVAPPAEIQAAVDVIGRRPLRAERYHIDLSYTDLRGVNLNNAQLDGADLLGAWLHDASMVRTHLRGAWLFAMQPSWQSVGEESFVAIEAVGITAIQLGNCEIDLSTRIAAELRQQITELKAWWDAQYPAESRPSWLDYRSADSGKSQARLGDQERPVSNGAQGDSKSTRD